LFKKYIYMNFIPLAEGLNRFFFRNKYDKTPQQRGVTMMLNSEGEILNPETIDAYDVFSTTPHLYSVVQKKGELLATGTWKHYKKMGDKNVLIENSDVLKLLEHPNPLYNSNDYLRLLNESKCLFGNTYKYLVKGTFDKLPRCIYILPSWDVKIITNGHWYLKTDIKDIIKEYQIISSQESLEVDKINHTWINNSKNPLQGETPLKNIYMSISNLRLGMKTRNVLMDKKGAIGILSNDTKDSVGNVNMTTEETLKIERQYQEDYGHEDGKGKIIISNQNLKWQAMGFPTRELMLFEEDENDFQQVCDNYGISRDLFAQVNKATYTNQNEALKQTYNTSIIPEAEEIAMNHTRMFGLDLFDEWLELDYSNVSALQENSKENAEIVKLKADSIKTLKDSGFTNDQITAITGISL
jgi:HK97 family phage portal protein